MTKAKLQSENRRLRILIRKLQPVLRWARDAGPMPISDRTYKVTLNSEAYRRLNLK